MSEEKEDEFKPMLPEVSKWFDDRSIPYTRRIESWLVDNGVDTTERMKLVKLEEWHDLLVPGTGKANDTYKKVEWRVFEEGYKMLTKHKFDHRAERRSLPIKDTTSKKDDAAGTKKKGQTRKCGGFSNGRGTLDGFISVQKKPAKKKMKTTADGNNKADTNVNTNMNANTSAGPDDVVVLDAAMPASDTSTQDVPAIEPFNWRRYRAGVDAVMNPADEVEKRHWNRHPPREVLASHAK